jgi:hypothetical protein
LSVTNGDRNTGRLPDLPLGTADLRLSGRESTYPGQLVMIYRAELRKGIEPAPAKVAQLRLFR